VGRARSRNGLSVVDARLGIASELALLLILVLVPGLRDIFGLAPLAFAERSVLLALPPAMLSLEEGRKWLMRKVRGA